MNTERFLFAVDQFLPLFAGCMALALFVGGLAITFMNIGQQIKREEHHRRERDDAN